LRNWKKQHFCRDRTAEDTFFATKLWPGGRVVGGLFSFLMENIEDFLFAPHTGLNHL
jgi:hypothetical protein